VPGDQTTPWISQQIHIPRQTGNTECGVIMLEVARRLLFKQSLDFSVSDRDIAVLRSRFVTELRAQQLTVSKPSPPPASEKGKEVMLDDHNLVFQMTQKEARIRARKNREAPEPEDAESAPDSDLNALSVGFSEMIGKLKESHLIEAAEFIKSFSHRWWRCVYPQRTAHLITMSSNNVILKSRIESLSARMIAIGLKGQALLDIIE
jgi:hypothetical protein